MVEAIGSFFLTGRMVPEANWMDVVLIPKEKGPEYVSHFKPISLCNYFYKVISKVMVNKVQPFLSNLVSKN